MNDAPLLESRIVYLGVREAVSDKKLFGYFCLEAAITSMITIDGLDEIASPFNFKQSLLPAMVGGIYTAPSRLSDDGKRVKSLAPNFTSLGEKIKNKGIVAACEARDRAARVAVRARKVEADMAKDHVLEDVLAPLKRSYSLTDTIGRLALEVVILAEIRKGRTHR